MAGGGYNGGSTILNAGSSWFSHTDPRKSKKTKPKVTGSERKIGEQKPPPEIFGPNGITTAEDEARLARRMDFSSKRDEVSEGAEAPTKKARSSKAVVKRMKSIDVTIKPRKKVIKRSASDD